MSKAGRSRAGKTALTRTTSIRIRISINRVLKCPPLIHHLKVSSRTREVFSFIHLLPFSVHFDHFSAFFSTRTSSHFHWYSHSSEGFRARAKAFSSTPRHQSRLAFTYVDPIFANLCVSVHLSFYPSIRPC